MPKDLHETNNFRIENPIKQGLYGLAFIGTALILFSAALYTVFVLLKWEGELLVFIFRLFDVGHETNLPVFYGASLWVLLSIFALVCGYLADRLKISWYLLALIAFLAALDEATMIHEHFKHFADLFKPLIGNSLISYDWVYAGIIAAILVATVFAPLALNLPTSVLIQLILGGAIFLFGAIVVEILTGHVIAHFGEVTWHTVMLIHFEEWLEYIGVIVAIYALSNMFSINRSQQALKLSWRGYKRASQIPKSAAI